MQTNVGAYWKMRSIPTPAHTPPREIRDSLELTTYLEQHPSIEVLTDMENHEGWTNSTDDDCKNVQVAVHANAFMFEDIFIGVINAIESTTITTTNGTTMGNLSDLILLALSSGLVAVVVLAVILLMRKTQ